MKSRKELKHQSLINETVEQVRQRFKPQVSDVKKAIDTLLEKECTSGGAMPELVFW